MLENLTETLNAKDPENFIETFKNIAANIMPLILAFSEFSRKCEETSEVCKGWNGLVEMKSRFQNVVSAEGEGNWDNHILIICAGHHGILKVFNNYSGNLLIMRYWP